MTLREGSLCYYREIFLLFLAQHRRHPTHCCLEFVVLDEFEELADG